MSLTPLVTRDVFNLSNVPGGLRPGTISFRTVTVQSDKFVCVRDQQGEGQTSVIVADMTRLAADRVSLREADAVIVHPSSRVMAVRVGSNIDVVKVDERSKVKDLNFQFGDIVYWTWANTTTLAFVTDSAVYHWSVDPNNSQAPQKIFDRDGRLADAQILGYKFDHNNKWFMINAVIRTDSGLAGKTQMFSAELNCSRVVDGHAGCFAPITASKTDNRECNVLCVATGSGTQARVMIMELPSSLKSDATFERRNLTVDIENGDFPIACHVSPRHKLLTIVTSRGKAFLLDPRTGQSICSEKVSNSQVVIFCGVPYEKTGGIMCVSSSGSVLHVSIDDDSICRHINSNSDHHHMFSGLKEKVTDLVRVKMSKSESVHLFAEVCSDEAWGPTVPDMNRLIQVYPQAYFELLPEIQLRFDRRKDNWRRAYKSLLIIDHFARNLEPRFLDDLRSFMPTLKEMSVSFFLTDEMGINRGFAVRERAKKVMQLLNYASSTEMPTTQEDFDALEKALKNNKIEDLKKILQNLDLTATNNDGQSCLMLCYYYSSPPKEVVKVILKKIDETGGPDLLKNLLAATDLYGRTCLMHCAHFSNSPQVVKLLAAVLFHVDLFKIQYPKLDDNDKKRLKEKALIDSSSWTPDAASLAEVKAILQGAALTKKKSPDKAAIKSLFDALERLHSVQEFKRILHIYDDELLMSFTTSATNKDGYSCLMLACRFFSNNLPTVSLGLTSEIILSLEVLELLFKKIIEAGGNALLKSQLTATDTSIYGKTCLMHACGNSKNKWDNNFNSSNPEVMKVLFEKIIEVGDTALLKSELSKTDRWDGSTCLMLACRETSQQVVKIVFEKIDEVGGSALLKHQLTATNNLGSTCLMLALGKDSSSPEVVKLILEKIVEVGDTALLNRQLTATSIDGWTCLMYACANSSSPDVVKVVLKKIIDTGGSALLKSQLTATSKHGSPCLTLCCERNSSSSSSRIMNVLALLLFHFDLFKTQYDKLDNIQTDRLKELTGIHSSSWLPDDKSLSEVKKMLPGLDGFVENTSERDAAAKKKAEDEAAAKKKAEEEAAAKKKAEEEAAAKKKAEEEAAALAKKKAEEEAATKKKTDDETARAEKKGDHAAAAKKKSDDEAARAEKKADDEAAAKKKADEEAALAKKKADDEAARAEKKADDEAAAKKKADEEAAANQKAQDEAAGNQKAEDEAAAEKKLLFLSIPRIQESALNIDRKSPIGSGATCSVYSCRYFHTVCAGKIFHSHITSDKAVQREMNAAIHLKHPNIVNVLAIIVDDTDKDKIIGILMQRMNGTLLQRVSNTSPYEDAAPPTTSDLIKWCSQTASAILCAHSLKCIHCDIKPENVMLDQQDVAHLTDFGSAHVMTTAATKVTSVRGTALYIAPEYAALDVEEPNEKTDVFSFGMLMWVVFHPAEDHKMGKSDMQIGLSLHGGKRPAISNKDLPAEIVSLIEKCWHKDADERPAMADVLTVFNEVIAKIEESEKAASSVFKLTPSPLWTDARYLKAKYGAIADHLTSLKWNTRTDAPSLHFSEDITDNNSPLFKFIEEKFRPSPGFKKEEQMYSDTFFSGKFSRLQMVQPADAHHLFLALHQADGSSRFANEFLRHRNNSDSATQNALEKLKSVFEDPEVNPTTGSVNFSRILFAWHGTTALHVEKVCRDGPRSLRATDPGYFGVGSYFALEVDYAAQYAKSTNAKGEYAIILFAVSVSQTYPITLEHDYRSKEDSHTPDMHGFCNFYNGTDPKKAIALAPKCDSHFIPVKKHGNGRQHPLGKYDTMNGNAVVENNKTQVACALDQQACDAKDSEVYGHEIVIGNHQRAVPVAILYFKY